MNIELQSCGLAMLLVLLVSFLKEKRLDLSSRRLFFWALISCLVCIAMDILSILGIHWTVYGTFPAEAARLLCKLYVISLLLLCYQGFLYSAGEFFAARDHRGLRLASRVLFFAACAAVVFLPIRYRMAGRLVYSYGPAVSVAYVAALIFIFSTIAMAFQATDHTAVRRRRCILLWQGLWLLAAVIQLLNPELLLASFAASFGMMLIYAELENPYEGLDRMTGQFTANALTSYVMDLYRHDRRFSSMHIRVEYRNQNVDPETERTAMLRISGFLNQDRDAYVFRQSDDEFTVIYRSRERMEAAYARAAAGLDEAVSLPVKLWYTLIPDSGILRSPEEFLRFHHYNEKDAANRQDCVTVDEEAVERMREYLRVQDMITQALREERVEVFYQPIYHLGRQRFTAAEALVRIRARDGSLVSPTVFIPIAEENGLIIPLGIEIFRQVCAFLSTGRAQRLGLEYVEVNLSIAQFDSINPAQFVQSTMEQYHVRSDWINLEITETASISAKQAVLYNMDKLLKSGIRFSLDDFGTGRSNLDYFVEMPVDVIKFDYSFTQGYFKSVKARYVVESMVDLMHRMGLSIVAEGVETKEQLQVMQRLGVTYIQGFYFAHPLPEAEFLQFLETRNAVV